MLYNRGISIARRSMSTSKKLILPLESGTVVWFDKRKGYGFIERAVELPQPVKRTPQGELPREQTPHIFVRFADIEKCDEEFAAGSLRYLRPGQKVEYYADVFGPQGTRCARKVRTVE